MTPANISICLSYENDVSDKDGTVSFSGSASIGKAVPNAEKDSITISAAQLDSVSVCAGAYYFLKEQ